MCEGRDEGGEAGETLAGDEHVCLGRRCRVQSRRLKGETGRETQREEEIPTSWMEPVSSGSSGTEEEGTLWALGISQSSAFVCKWVRLAQTSAHHLGSCILKPNHHWELFCGLPRSPGFLLQQSLGTCLKTKGGCYGR